MAREVPCALGPHLLCALGHQSPGYEIMQRRCLSTGAPCRRGARQNARAGLAPRGKGLPRAGARSACGARSAAGVCDSHLSLFFSLFPFPSCCLDHLLSRLRRSSCSLCALALAADISDGSPLFGASSSSSRSRRSQMSSFVLARVGCFTRPEGCISLPSPTPRT